MTANLGSQELVNQTFLPLLIGVTGHRDIPSKDIPDLKKQVRSVMDHIKNKYQTTPLMLMSALADGADRLVAEVALDVGIGLIAALPMNRDIYEQDFSTDSNKQFQALMTQAAISYELPLEKGNSEDLVRSGGTARDVQYHAVGRFIVKHCQVLIALWDGVTHGPTGGTSQVVRMQLEGIDSRCADGSNLFNTVQTGPVYYIPTKRLIPSNSSLDVDFIKRHHGRFDKLERVQLLHPLSDDGKRTREDEYTRISSCIERFNKDSNICQLVPAFESGRKQAAGYLIPENTPPFSQADLSTSARYLLNCFAHADNLAQQFQKKTHRMLLLLAALVPFIVFFFETYSNVTTTLLAIVGYLSFLGLAYGTYAVTHRQGIHEKFLDYRALAEGLRVGLFWHLAGVREDPAAFYLSKQQSELDWIRYAIRTWILLAKNGTTTPAPQLFDMVRKYWLEDQQKYFERTAIKHKQSADNLSRLATLFFRMGFFALTPAMLIIHGMKLGGDNLDPWMQVATPFTFVIAGSLKYYVEQMLYAEQAKQYARMYAIFTRSLELLDAVDDDQLLRHEIILAVGREALVENGDWMLMHRERPIEVPQG